MTAFIPVKVFFCTGDRESLVWSGRGQGRRFLAFISTLDPVPTTATIAQGTKLQMFFLSFVPWLETVLRCETIPEPVFVSQSFAMATLGSINHVFGLVVHHDYLYKLFPLPEEAGRPIRTSADTSATGLHGLPRMRTALLDLLIGLPGAQHPIQPNCQLACDGHLGYAVMLVL
jgi:hypothetical protein